MTHDNIIVSHIVHMQQAPPADSVWQKEQLLYILAILLVMEIADYKRVNWVMSHSSRQRNHNYYKHYVWMQMSDIDPVCTVAIIVCCTYTKSM